MKRRVNFEKQIYGILLHVGAFLILLEWIRPLPIVAETQEISYFVVFIAWSFLSLMIRIPFYYDAVIKIIFIAYSVQKLYFTGTLLETGWVGTLINTFYNDVQNILSLQFYNLSFEIRSVLCFTLLWIVSYLIHYWLFYRRSIFLFFFLTIVYITVLDTFTAYDAKYAIIRTVAIGFSLIGLLHVERLKSSELKHFFSEYRSHYSALLIFSVLLSVTVAYLVPKPSPQWPDPVPFLQAYNAGEGPARSASAPQRAGYGLDDSQLGGAFVQDDTIVFTAEASKKHYWRIETKDLYTGKGWELSDGQAAMPMEENSSLLPQYSNEVDTEMLEATIQLAKPSFHLMYPLQLLALEPNVTSTLRVNPISEKLYPYKGEKLIELEGYKVIYNNPNFEVENLRDVSPLESITAEESEAGFKERYTQLPSSLPARVRELALEITSGKTNMYDQVKAIETYFKINPYVYDTQEVAVPDSHEDYVDQFLFETKKGYCDNFSTSMVVMLRSLDIPARWVKGYTSGEALGSPNENGMTRYEVTQNNAHSWVEVYFPEIGWIPFEPTKSFTNPYEFTQETASLNETDSTIQESSENESTVPAEKEEPAEQDASRSENHHASSFVLSLKSFIIALLFLLTSSWIMYVTRKRWVSHLIIAFFKHRKSKHVFREAYFLLLKLLEYQGLKRSHDQTLRQYAKQVDESLNSTEMTLLTEKYERVLYRKEENTNHWEDAFELWENLVKKMGS